MLIKNVFIENSENKQDVRIENEKFIEIGSHLASHENEQTIEANGKLLLPPFIDSHVHLDATLTAGEPEWNQTGTLFDGIRIWSERKKTLSREDVKTRAKATIKKQVENGIQVVRSHVDTTDPTMTALEALLEVKEEMKDIVEVQLVAFPQEGVLSYPHGKELLETAVKE